MSRFYAAFTSIIFYSAVKLPGGCQVLKHLAFIMKKFV
jgi:hypothetical protein